MLTIQVVASKFPPEYAGAGLRILNTYQRIVGRGNEIRWSVIAGSIEFPGNANYRYEEVDVERISSRLFVRFRGSAKAAARIAHALRSWLEAARLWRTLAKRRFDLLHIFGSSSVTAAAIAFAAAKRRRLIIELVTTRASPLQVLPGLRIAPFLRRWLKKNALIVAISQSLADRCAAEGFAKNVWIRPNPVDTKRYFPEFERRHELRAFYTPFGADDVVLGMVAKFMPQKNQIFLIDVIAKLPERFKLVLAGPLVAQGPLAKRDLSYFSDLQNHIAKSDIADRIHILPEFVNAEYFIKLSDVYMLPNHDEGLATPMLESLACGVPVIGNASEPAFRQWIEDGRNGFLRPLDSSSWAEAVQKIAGIASSQMLEAAKSIADLASAEMVDSQFLCLVEALAALPPGKPFDVVASLRNRA